MDYNRQNCDRYHEFRNYLFKTTLTESQRAVLNDRMFPTIEFNIGEMFVNRLRGEFGEQQPSVTISAVGTNSPLPKELMFLEDHLRYRMHDFHTDGLGFNVISQTLSGGFSGIICDPDYLHPMSMEQDVFLRYLQDPTLLIFDPDAKECHKGDGNYCTELVPMTKPAIESKFGYDVANKIKYKPTFQGFSWAYENSNEKVAILCSHYYKEYVQKKIVEVVDMGTMTIDKYDAMLDNWKLSGNPFPPPGIVGKPRKTIIDVIHHIQFFDDIVVYAKKTENRYLPAVFVDGNSAFLQKTKGQNVTQMTRPYIYNLRGVQDFKNFAAQTWANYIENIVQSKWMIPDGGIPDGAEDDYKDPQNASNLFYNAYDESSPEKQLPAPIPIQQAPLQAEVINAFSAMDQTSQMVTGSFNASLGINDNQLSGKAINAGAGQSNPTAMPFVFNYIQALNRVGLIYLDMFPKIVLKRGGNVVETFIKRKDGKQHAITIHDYQEDFKYDPETLKIKIEAGPSFAIQKHRAIEQITQMMSVSPKFAEFMNSMGLPVLLKNLDFEGSDQLVLLAEEWIKKEQEAMEIQRKQAQGMPNPDMAKIQIEIKKLVQQAMKDQKDAELKERALNIQQQNADTNKAKVLSDIEQKEVQAEITKHKAIAEITKADDELEMKKIEVAHEHTMDILNRHHDNQHQNKDRDAAMAKEVMGHMMTANN